MKFITITSRGGERCESFAITDEQCGAVFDILFGARGAPADIDPNEVSFLRIGSDAPYEDEVLWGEPNDS